MQNNDILVYKLQPALDEFRLHQRKLRELRNQSAREYPGQSELLIVNLRRLVESVPLLEQALGLLQQYASQGIVQADK